MEKGIFANSVKVATTAVKQVAGGDIKTNNINTKKMKKLTFKILFRAVITLLVKCIAHSKTPLTGADLIAKGFYSEGGFTFTETHVKGRDRITVMLDSTGYRVYHSDNMIFVAAESSKEWFDAYFMLIHQDNRI